MTWIKPRSLDSFATDPFANTFDLSSIHKKVMTLLTVMALTCDVIILVTSQGIKRFVALPYHHIKNVDQVYVL